VHAVKASVRPALTIGSAGMFNPLVSAAEDGLAIAASLIAIFAPLVALLLVALFVAVGLGLLLHRRQRRTAS
ncbi:MAG: DUF4126 domain-containing protein, partial [Thermomicrobiales bacterium]|nr:DUF4126 domain-containing protein [Thermomicrobiales bacterium]